MFKTILRVALLVGVFAAPIVAQADIIETRTIHSAHVVNRHHHHHYHHHHHHYYKHHRHHHHHR